MIPPNQVHRARTPDRPGRRRPIRALAVLAALAGCAHGPLIPFDPAMPPMVNTGLADAGITDLRAEYRAALCRRTAAMHDVDCRKILRTIAGEAPAVAGERPAMTAASAGTGSPLKVVLVPGLFSDCTDGRIVPFADVAEGLRADGHEVHLLRVAGRGSSEHNARMLAEQLERVTGPADRVVMIAYSKGLPDALQMLAAHPGPARRVGALIAYAGAFNGSPLADRYGGLYRLLGAHFPMSGCTPGDGQELEALRRTVRIAWWQENRARITVPVFALVGAPTAPRVSPALRALHDELSAMDPLNDAQVLASDAILPGGSLLGYVDADHWAIAIPVTQQLPLLSGWFIDDVPRTALVRAALDVVRHRLASAPPSRTPR